MSKIKMHMDSNFIYFFNEKLQKLVRYDLIRKIMQKQDSRGNWNEVQQQYEFFKGYGIEDIECNDEDLQRFRQLLLISSKINPKCSSLSTFVSRLNESLVYENYAREGIRTECYVPDGRYGSKRVLTKPLEFYHKYVIAFFKKYDIEVNCSIENSFKSDYEFSSRLVISIENTDLIAEDKQDALSLVGYYRTQEELRYLVKDLNYDLKSLLKYLYNYLKPFEDIKPAEALNLLKDYAQMCCAIGRNFKKYPHYLKSIHDIVSANYKSFKKEYDENRFRMLMKKELEYEEKDFCIVVPESSKDIVQEGIQLNHCVSSYVDRILRQETYIFFLRKTENKTESLITLEIRNNKIVQAKGSYNRPLVKEELNFLQTYSKKKGVELEL